MAKQPKSNQESLDPQGMQALIAEHLEWMRTVNYSAMSVEDRNRYLGYFMSWCKQREVTRPSEVTRAVLERYRKALYHYRKKDGSPLSFRSQNARLVAVRMLFKWLSKQRHILYNPAADLELPRAEKRLPKNTLTVSEAEQVLNQPNIKTITGIRDRAILETFYSTGMRRSELIHLRVDDMDVERQTLMIRQGKGRKDRMVPLGERALKWIDKYLLEARPEIVVEPDCGTLFLTRHGEPFDKNHLTLLVSRHMKASGIDKKGSCHLFRHTTATLMLEGGADIRYIQQMLGHEDLRSTQRYTEVSIQKLKQVHANTHPGACLRKASQPLG